MNARSNFFMVNPIFLLNVIASALFTKDTTVNVLTDNSFLKRIVIIAVITVIVNLVFWGAVLLSNGFIFK